MTPKQPPRLATWMLKHFGSGPNIDAVLGDLAEQYQQKDSAVWYWRQAIKAIPVSLVREIRAHKGIAARALLTGWGLWTVALMWLFPFAMPYFFDLHGTGIAAALSADHPIASVSSLLWMPIGAPFSINNGGILHLYPFAFSVILPFVVAAICGWLVARFHRDQQRTVVLLFAGSMLLAYAVLFGPFVLQVGVSIASLFVGPLAAYVFASVLGVLGGGLLRDFTLNESR